ncbi:VWA domain containing CoxE-like protein [Pseudovibrio sp. Ad5]|uniref:vWA domain-containing protein n=1 Tax=Pseudovibrio sp. Ad5 TaxID=989436 RepID=UPI0007AEA373|nr:VWA domain-containing protein [Pseudovibrio sp. Ad5]KZK93452.1 VWA domain containing CoxE-like protein [Pseudovibrio sp. Ad5]
MQDTLTPAPSPRPPHGRITENIVHFARTLRKAGLPAGPSSVVDAVSAVTINGIENKQDLYWTLHSVFVHKRDQQPVFDEAFRLYWQSKGLVEKMLALLSPVAPAGQREPEKPRAAQSRVANAFEANKQRGAKETKPLVEVDARFTVSEKEVLQKKDFAQMTAEEIAEARRSLARLTMPADQVRSRRFKPVHSHTLGKQVDARRTMRATLKAGGSIIDLKHKAPAQVHPPVVALCDISGSMSQYSRIMLHFLHALSEKRKTHTFLFGTRLTNITRALRMKDPDEALAACTDEVEDWSGGTRIASSLQTFNRTWLRRVCHGGPIVLLITDGLEREAYDELSVEMDRLHRSCRRLIWLNPLLRYDKFEAKARGIQAILPHTDEFRAIHSMDAVKDLCLALNDKRINSSYDATKRFL